MNKVRALLGVLLLSLMLACGSSSQGQSDPTDNPKESVKVASGESFSGLQSGDIIFQESQSAQSEAVQAATGSRYSHMGIVYLENNRLLVYEAVQPVKLTPLDEFIARGKGGHAVVKRLKGAAKMLTPQSLEAMKIEAEKHQGKNYDLTFTWDDERMYCSELVYKMFDRGTGVKVGSLQTLGDLDLSHPAVKQKLTERYGDSIPLYETVITPKAMFDSTLLETVTTYP